MKNLTKLTYIESAVICGGFCYCYCIDQVIKNTEYEFVNQLEDLVGASFSPELCDAGCIQKKYRTSRCEGRLNEIGGIGELSDVISVNHQISQSFSESIDLLEFDGK